MTLNEWKDLFKAAIAQRQWNVYSPAVIKNILAVEENEDTKANVLKYMRVYESVSVTSSGERGHIAPMSPRWLVHKAEGIVVDKTPGEDTLMAEDGRVIRDDAGGSVLLETQSAGNKTTTNTK